MNKYKFNNNEIIRNDNINFLYLGVRVCFQTVEPKLFVAVVKLTEINMYRL